MKIITPCCKTIQDYTGKLSKTKRRTTKCKKCKKQFDIKPELILKTPEESSSNTIFPPTKRTPGNGGSAPLPYNYDNINIKSLIKNWSIHQLYKDSRLAGQALQALVKPEFIEQGEVKTGIYWTSDMPPYTRPNWLFPWQSTGMELLKNGHCMWQAGRQKIGKTTGAFVADFEDMLETPNTVIGLCAPGVTQCQTLLRQGFKEVITLEDGSKFDLWNQLFKPYFIVDNANKKVMKNGSMIYIIPLEGTTAPGYAIDILHIEEIDKAVADPRKLRGLGAIFPTIRARRGHAKIRITCNNRSGVYRILRDDLKHFGQYFPIYMEKPWDIKTQKFTGKHFIYNDHIHMKAQPDIDEILTVIMDCLMGQGYTAQQLGNVDDYSGDVFNPDKLELAYRKVYTKKAYPEVVMGIDPGAIHAWAVTIFGKEFKNLYHLWTGRFTISGKTEDEKEKMIQKIVTTCARMYVQFGCTQIASESNSGAKLIIPMLNSEIRKEIGRVEGKTLAEVNKPFWSNFGADREEGQDQKKIYSKSDYMTLMQFLLDEQLIGLKDENEADHRMKIEFSRYNPRRAATDDRYKGDCVEASFHACWTLCKGYEFIETFVESDTDEEEAYTF